MKHIPEKSEPSGATIAKYSKNLAWTLAAVTLAVATPLVLRKFPRLLTPAAAIAIGIFLILLLWLFPKWQARSIVGLDPKDSFDRENEARKTLSQIFGGLILLIGFYFTWQNLVLTQENLRVASEGQITDRFTKAIAELGDTKLEIRLGGIYALERIAKDSPEDHWPIMEVLTAYVREHAKIKTPATPTPPSTNVVQNKPQFATISPEVQAILTVIGRRTMTYENGDAHYLDLEGTDLSGADLRDANLRGAILNGARLFMTDFSRADLAKAGLTLAVLEGARLIKTDLSDANFGGAVLQGVSLFRARLKGADFSGAILSHENLAELDLSGVNFAEADLRSAVLPGANLDGANLSGADLSTAIGLSPEQLERTKGSEATRLPAGMPHPKSWQ